MAANKLRLHSLHLHFTDGELPSIFLLCFGGGSIKGIAKIGVHCIYKRQRKACVSRAATRWKECSPFSGNLFSASENVSIYILIFDWCAFAALYVLVPPVCVCVHSFSGQWPPIGSASMAKSTQISNESRTLERGKERRKAKHSLHNGSRQWMCANIIMGDTHTHTYSVSSQILQLDRKT